MQRYTTEIDQDRLAAGWGRHCWILDHTKEGEDRYLRLLPECEAEESAWRLNLAAETVLLVVK